jgi:hypothetical protein
VPPVILSADISDILLLPNCPDTILLASNPSIYPALMVPAVNTPFSIVQPPIFPFVAVIVPSIFAPLATSCPVPVT